MTDLPKAYNPGDVEDKIYKLWEDSGFFNPDNLERADDRFWKAELFSIAMPPPNATGTLHLGHAIMLAIEDAMVRYARMSGKKTLWLPGTDHAAIATQNVVERQILKAEQKTRQDLGRAELLKRIEDFVATTRGQIQTQIRKMGSSCDWSREKFTLAPEMQLAVRTAFKKLYDAGLVYRGDRIVNWCPKCGTTLADDEVDFKSVKGEMFYIRYPLKDSDESLTVATVRPETMLGDTGVAVNPKDPRYTKYVGKILMLPLLNREIPVVADDHVDPEFGTGAVKVTPGHDLNDFEIAKRHNLEIINLYTPDGRINPEEATDHGFDDYAGLAAEQAREKILTSLRDLEFLEKTEAIEHRVGFCYRSDSPVEPVVSKQWFINVNEKFKVTSEKFKKLLGLDEENTLKEMMTAAVQSKAINIVPERFEKNYYEWMNNLRDWNISRQLWYGHRIPVWYCQNCSATVVAIETPNLCPECHDTLLNQDEDTLDTWFSSGLWTFSTLGWPNETEDLRIYHPTAVLETGYDILFFWIARMILLTGFVLEDIPFHTVYLHGLVRDLQGKKMSKSSGNGIDPVEMINKYGADALRLSLMMGITPGNDLRISETKIAEYRNFVNKLWNISRFILGKIEDTEQDEPEDSPPTLAESWILSRLDAAISSVNARFAKHDYGNAAEDLMKFTWNELADWYLEISKIEGLKPKIGKQILETLLKLWHPFAPFVTEYIWSQFNASLLIVQEYPTEDVNPDVKSGPRPERRGSEKSKVLEQFHTMQQLITGLRNLRSEYQQEPKKTLSAYLEIDADRSWIKDHTQVIERLTRTKLNFEKMDERKKMPYFLWETARVFLIIPHFDPKTEIALTDKKLKETVAMINKLGAQIKKPGFLKKAPPEIVEKMKADLEAAENRASALKAKIKQLR